jgi:hypothetical protein
MRPEWRLAVRGAAAGCGSQLGAARGGGRTRLDKTKEWTGLPSPSLTVAVAVTRQ